ncbi:MAG: nicotinate (nicotinamide) nucleotide adenylyltransferase [Elusimicrobia bacterium RIFOXYD2_FULL_34_15]|nr:MAG: nicotinate (nicotinamide) nucleotide adenylyltransferase [Elusimicrobia bacterium RIFOXYD2_FULL_34_15]
MKRIGLFGGSFDPIHNGHIKLAEKALKQLKLDVVYFVPAYLPPHKSRKLTDILYRKKMLKIALAEFKNAVISDFEIKRETKTYTYQLVEYFHKKYTDAELYLIIGSDSAIDFNNWKNSKKITMLSKVVFGEREKYNFNANKSFTELTGKIPNISSTDIRNRVKQGNSIESLVPPEIECYIIKHGLYK